MSKRGYKLQEFVAHSGNVNCLNIGKKACRLFLTGGDDYKVNLWAIGKPNSLMSLCGHTSPVDSVAFDSAEVLVLGGASSGVIKLWDLEEAKMVRGLTGHRSNCTAVEFHPFGEFFASGSMDTNLKIWDIRKKGCIHTYKGHTRGISTIRFTPDGRWVVSGGYDNVVKVWDLTAGKLLHDFKYHESHIWSIDFHPLEFLLATGSADGTVQFWDLETFEIIGSSRPEEAGVRAITFHPDGRTLFCGLDDTLKVYSWEPVICHDAIDMGWSTLGDLCIHEGKFLGCSYYQNSVGIWVADISMIEPYAARLSQKDIANNELNVPGSHSSAKVGAGIRSTLASRCVSPDSDAKDIKNIYVDTADGNPVSPQQVNSLNSPNVIMPSSKYTTNVGIQRQGSVTVALEKSNVKVIDKSLASPNGESRESAQGKDSFHSRRESITFSRTKPGMLLRPAHSRRPSNTKFDIDRLSNSSETTTPSITQSGDDSPGDLGSKIRVAREDKPGEPCGENPSIAKKVLERFDKALSLETPKPENCDKPHVQGGGVSSVKIVNGVAVVSGRTRSLVERFERREKLSSSEEQAVSITQSIKPQEEKTPVSEERFERKERLDNSGNQTSCMPDVTPDVNEVPSSVDEGFKIKERLKVCENQITSAPRTILAKDNTPTSQVGGFQRRERVKSMDDQLPDESSVVHQVPSIAQITPEVDKTPSAPVESFEGRERFNISEKQVTDAARAVSAKDRTAPGLVGSFQRRERFRRTNDQMVPVLPGILPTSDGQAIFQAERFERVEKVNSIEDQATLVNTSTVPATERAPTTQGEEPKISARESDSSNKEEATEILMQSHEVFLSTLRSRLTKLQVVRHFCDRNDMKGAIDDLKKHPDHSVQADVINILMEKMEILNLDLFSCLLPVLIGLLDSKIERHIILSLEMLLKLVAVFGSVVRVTVSAPPIVGVDLHAEQRRKCCNECFMQLQKIRKILPLLVRRGGVTAKSAQELNLVLQQT